MCLSVDRHALEAVNLLDLSDQELVQGRRPEDLEESRADRPAPSVRCWALWTTSPGCHDDVLCPAGIKMLLLLRGPPRSSRPACRLPRTVPSKATMPVDAGHFGRFLGPAGFEELGHPRQAAR